MDIDLTTSPFVGDQNQPANHDQTADGTTDPPNSTAKPQPFFTSNTNMKILIDLPTEGG